MPSCTITVTAKDAYGNTATGYTGTVHFTGGGTPPDSDDSLPARWVQKTCEAL